jgi:hypothetical protein
MVREIFQAKAGILFLTDRLYEIGLDPSTVYPVVHTRPSPLSVEKEHKIREPSPAELPYRHSMLNFGRKPLITESQMLASEEHEELMDALSPVYDQMRIKKWWWLLEFIPLPFRRVWHGKSTTRLR